MRRPSTNSLLKVCTSDRKARATSPRYEAYQLELMVHCHSCISGNGVETAEEELAATVDRKGKGKAAVDNEAPAEEAGDEDDDDEEADFEV